MKYKDIDLCDSLNSYEWDEFHVMRGADGYLYTAEGRGCSCYGFYDYFSEAESGFEALDGVSGDPVKCDSWVQVLNNIKKWASEGYNHERDSVALSLMLRIADTKPVAFDRAAVVVEQED